MMIISGDKYKSVNYSCRRKEKRVDAGHAFPPWRSLRLCERIPFLIFFCHHALTLAPTLSFISP